MLEVRLKRRLRALNIDSYGEYCDYLFGQRWPEARRWSHLIDVVTTNKTDFFREPKHFDFLTQRRCRNWLRAAERTAAAGVERRVFDGRRAVHAGDGAERIRGDASGISFPHPGHGYFDHGAGEGGAGRLLHRRWWNRCRRRCRRNICMRSRDRGSGSGARGAGTAQAGGVPAAELHGRRLRTEREGRRDLLPQRDHLLRPADAGTDSAASLPTISCRAGILFVGHAETLHDMDLPLEPVAPALYRRADGRG